MTKKFNYGRLGQPFDVEWPVVVAVPADGGKVEEETFTAVFRISKDDELVNMAMGVNASIEALKKVFVGLGKAEDQALTDQIRDDMLATSHVRTAISRAYVDCSLGIGTKN